MTAPLNQWPGGEGCPLARFRARVVVYGLGLIAAASFAVALWTIVYGGRP